MHYAAKSRSGPTPVYRVMPDEVALRVYQNNKKFYDPILKRRDLAKALAAVKASVLLISGCQDNPAFARRDLQRPVHRQFEGGLEWGTFVGLYRRFHTAIGSKMPPDQTPKLSMVGASSAAFIAQQPFTINAPKKGRGK